MRGGVDAPAGARTVARAQMSPNDTRTSKAGASPRRKGVVMRIGIDVSKEKLDVAMSDGRQEVVANNKDGIAEFVSRMKGETIELVVMECTGHYERAVLYALTHANIPAVAVNPRQVRSFAMARGKLAKTDSIDAAVLCDFAERMRPEVRPLPEPELLALQAKVLRRMQLIEMRTMEKNRLASHLTVDAAVRSDIEETIRFLNSRIKEVEKDIDKHLRGEKRWDAKLKIITSMPGVGKVISATLIALLPELGTLSDKKLTALAGLAPYNNDSGKHVGEKHCWGGRAKVRTALYLAAVTAIRTAGTPLQEKYKRLRARNKASKVALVACAHSLLIHLNAMVRTQKLWTASPLERTA